MIIYPQLVRAPRTPISGILEDGAINYNGKGNTHSFSSVCIFQETEGKKKINRDEKEVLVNAEAYICGDILPEVAEIVGGEVEVFGRKYRVVSCSRKRDFSGHVNYTKLGLK